MPKKCQAEVFTYHQRGYHRCYREATIVVEGVAYCRPHAKAAIRKANKRLEATR